MTKRSTKIAIDKTADDMQPKDRFYIAGKKYCVTHDKVRDEFGRLIITFVEVDGDPMLYCDMHVPDGMKFMVLTGESGIGEQAYQGSHRKS